MLLVWVISRYILCSCAACIREEWIMKLWFTTLLRRPRMPVPQSGIPAAPRVRVSVGTTRCRLSETAGRITRMQYVGHCGIIQEVPVFVGIHLILCACRRTETGGAHAYFYWLQRRPSRNAPETTRVSTRKKTDRRPPAVQENFSNEMKSECRLKRPCQNSLKRNMRILHGCITGRSLKVRWFAARSVRCVPTTTISLISLHQYDSQHISMDVVA